MVRDEGEPLPVFPRSTKMTREERAEQLRLIEQVGPPRARAPLSARCEVAMNRVLFGDGVSQVLGGVLAKSFTYQR